MGGIAFVVAILFSGLISIPLLFKFTDNKKVVSLLISLIYAILNALIGIADDLCKLKRKENQGLTPIQKLLLQFSFAILFLYARHTFIGDSTAISFAFGEIDLGFFYYPLSLTVLVGIINFANLTDGIDGLATSVAFSIAVSLLYISAALSEDVAIISSAIIGAAVAFLIFNLHPAKIFMGDTGSLFLGAIISSCSFMLENPIIILLIAGVYVLEGISVVLQVAYYKITKKRLFKMAPIHHHFEQCGWSENKICIVSILVTFVLSIPAYILYLP
jgi:phospho-N-acetylmuramoyl-pentapeptide-transferase